MEVEEHEPRPRGRRQRRQKRRQRPRDEEYDDGDSGEEYYRQPRRRKRIESSPPRKRARYSQNPDVQILEEKNRALQNWATKQRVKRMKAESDLAQSRVDFKSLGQYHHEYKRLSDAQRIGQGIRLRRRYFHFKMDQ